MSFPKRTVNQKSDLYDAVHKHSCILDTREIFLFSESDESDLETKTAVTLEKNLRFLESISHDPILIYLNNEGGCLYSAFSIYDIISNCAAHITLIGFGCIASGASIIMQAADVRLLMPTSCFLVHYGESGGQDHAIGAISTAEQTKLEQKIILDIYAKKCQNGEFFQGKTIKYIKQYIDRKIKEKVHWYMSNVQAKEYGFIDGILGETKYISIERLLEK